MLGIKIGQLLRDKNKIGINKIMGFIFENKITNLVLFSRMLFLIGLKRGLKNRTNPFKLEKNEDSLIFCIIETIMLFLIFWTMKVFGFSIELFCIIFVYSIYFMFVIIISPIKVKEEIKEVAEIEKYEVGIEFVENEQVVDSIFMGVYWACSSTEAIRKLREDIVSNHYKVKKPTKCCTIKYLAKKA